MLILTAQNITKENDKLVLVRTDGTADYDVWIGVNHNCIWRGTVTGHKRDDGAQTLLHLIAYAMTKDFIPASGPVEEALRRILNKPECPKCKSKRLRCENGCTWPI